VRGIRVSRRPKPKNIIERLFIQKAEELLPVALAEINRNKFGILCYKWISPCPEIEALWVSICPKEIVLSCKISHNHIARTDYIRQKRITNIDLKRRIVRDGIREVSLFLQGQIAATIAYDENGNQHGSGWCNRNQLASGLEHMQKVFGSGMTQCAWVWSGEVNLTNS
jgi:hypothetical protein